MTFLLIAGTGYPNKESRRTRRNVRASLGMESKELGKAGCGTILQRIRTATLLTALPPPLVQRLREGPSL